MPRYARILAALPLLALGLLLTQCADSDSIPTTTPPVVSSTVPTSSTTPSPTPTTLAPTPEPIRVEVPDPPPVPPVPARPARVTDDDSSGGSAYYKNCGAARAAGAAPLHAGEPGYGSHLDRDGDGTACE